MPDKMLRHEFVEFIPDKLEEGIIYVSIALGTASHKCVCGCGNEVVTPITPTDWELTYDGESVSLDPSIGNWSFPCQSHYWITRDRASWAPRWSEKKIAAGRAHDRVAKQEYFDKTEKPIIKDASADLPNKLRPVSKRWRRPKRES